MSIFIIVFFNIILYFIKKKLDERHALTCLSRLYQFSFYNNYICYKKIGLETRLTKISN